jgi:acyl phosphate:glycerol-3-phosphate acyltransferase
MSADPVAIATIACAYLLGSIPFGLLLARLRSVDVRKAGSGNIGATNVARTAGKKLGVVVLLLDALKGAVPMLVAFALDLGTRAGPYAITLVGLAAIAGHCFPIWLKFRGGKGVATALGVFLVLDPLSIALASLLFALLYAAFRVVSIGSMAASASVPLLLLVFGRPPEAIALGAAGAAIVIFQHRGNLQRLLRGSEHRL